MDIVNERLRTVMLRRGYTPEKLARECGASPRTANRWIKPGRVPIQERRWKIAHALDVDEFYLWPQLLDESQSGTDAEREESLASELMRVYPDRSSVPRDTWLQLLTGANEHIDILVFSGTFFAQFPRIAEMLAERAAAGVTVRLCLGDPDSQAVDIRDREECLHGTLAHKIRASLSYFRDLPAIEGCEVRLHGVTLYASLFRYDDNLMANPHMWGEPASANPLLHLRRMENGGWFDRYRRSFDAVWQTAAPWDPEEKS